MKEETKNEMDLLLRRLGRRDDANLPDAGHLDADELSAYAENALPVAARARYTAHLAECSRCRNLVVQLSSAAGVVVATETANVSKPSAWRTFLASLFTPMVLRYAVPALGLIVVAAIGFVVLRREQQADRFVAQETKNEQQQPPGSAAQPDAKPFTFSTNADGVSSPQELHKQAANKQSQVPAPPPNAPPTVSSVDADVSKDKAAPQAQAQPKPEEQTATANEAPPPPKSEPTATVEVSQKSADTEATKKEDETRKKEVRGMATVASPTAQREVSADRKRDDKDNFSRAPQAADKVAGVGSAGSVAKLKGDNLSANTRSVAGRRFQKRGGVWIDTAYDSSKEVVSVTRGSEQYRGLVADEPQIKTIADELDGEIIVVWKGHTYRIR